MTDRGPASVGPPLANRRPPRVFVGLKMAPEIAAELAGIARDLERDDVRRVAPDDIHLTLVPPWDEASLSDAIEKLRLVAERFGAFPLAIRHVRYGPQLRWPRLLWAECLAAEELVALRAALLDAFGQQDERPFRPHVTLARIRGNGREIARNHPIDRELSLTQRIETVELFQSPPKGERGFRILASCRLGETAKSVAST
jgi:2'-5' RNA ligase